MTLSVEEIKERLNVGDIISYSFKKLREKPKKAYYYTPPKKGTVFQITPKLIYFNEIGKPAWRGKESIYFNDLKNKNTIISNIEKAEVNDMSIDLDKTKNADHIHEVTDAELAAEFAAGEPVAAPSPLAVDERPQQDTGIKQLEQRVNQLAEAVDKHARLFGAIAQLLEEKSKPQTDKLISIMGELALYISARL